MRSSIKCLSASAMQWVVYVDRESAEGFVQSATRAAGMRSEGASLLVLVGAL